MVKMEIENVCPLKPLFYSRYVDDIYNRSKNLIKFFMHSTTTMKILNYDRDQPIEVLRYPINK